MRILLVADIHYALKQYDWLLSVAADFDVLCIAGDLLEISSPVSLTAQVVVVRSYLERLADRTHLLVCSGNHDITGEGPSGERMAHWLPSLADSDVVTDGHATAIGGTVFSVLPWWDGPKTRKRIARQLAKDATIPKQTWIWVHHAPPSESITSWSGRRHHGDTYLRDWIVDHRPDAVFSGHVHQAPFADGGSWVDKVGDTWVFNMGQQPGDAPAHIVLDLTESEAAWFSIAGAETVRLRGAPSPRAGLPDWVRAADPSSGGA